MKKCINVLLLCLIIQTAQAQDSTRTTIYRKANNLSGPRFGVGYLSKKFVNYVDDKRDVKLQPLVTQFGWQFEKRFFTVRSGATAISEWVVLVGGLEQSKILPSASWLIGMRSGTGFEIAMGPNLSLSGASMVVAAGITHSTDEINFPINFVVALSKAGPRFGLLVGFNLKDQ